MKTTQEQKTIKAAIYVRVSTDEQAELGYSIEAQKEKLLAFCKSQDWEVYNTYVDDGFKAINLNRPKIQKLLEEANQQKFNVVVFYKLDRLSRSVKDLNNLIEVFEKNNITIKSVTEPFDTSSPPGKLMFNMLGSFAQFERELIGERTKFGLNRAVKEGKWVTYPPFGYKIKNGQLILDEKEIVFYKRMVELLLYHNRGTKMIARILNEEDKITRRAGKWADSTVWNMLNNPVYCGLVRWNDQIFPGKHKAVISQETFQQIRERLHEKNQVPPGIHSSPNFLNKLLFCGKCNSLISTSKGKKHYYYVCTKRQKDNNCDLNYIRADDLHKAVLGQIEEVINQPKIIRDAIKESQKNSLTECDQLKDELQNTKRKVVELNKQKERKLSWLSTNLPDKKVVSHVSKEINETDLRIAILENRITQIESKTQEGLTGKTNVEIIGQFLKQFRISFDELDNRERRLFIQSIVKEVIIYSDDKIKLSFSLPVPPPKGVASSINSMLKKGDCSPFYSTWGG